jgi:zinc transporter 1
VRAEVVGALINGVFLLAVCFSITIDSIGRFADIEEIKDPEPVAHNPNARLSLNFRSCPPLSLMPPAVVSLVHVV